MSQTLALIIAAVISVTGVLGGALLARNASIRGTKVSQEAAKAVNELDERKVNLEEFKELRSALNERIDALESQVKTEQEARKEAETRAMNAERRAARLEVRVDQLERALEANHIDVPPPTVDLSD